MPPASIDDQTLILCGADEEWLAPDVVRAGPEFLEDPLYCWVCGQPAQYLDLSFEAAVCGGICVWAAWEALRLHDTKWRAWGRQSWQR